MFRRYKDINVENERIFVKSLAKGLSIIMGFSELGRPMTLTEIATAQGFNKTTVTRLCNTLVELGFLMKDDHKRFHLTPKVLSLGTPWIANQDWRKVAEPYLKRLFDKFKLAVNIVIWDGPVIIYVYRIQESDFPADIRLGSRVPVHSVAGGKIFMALGPPQRVKAVLRNYDFRPLTPHTITDIETFRQELVKVRKNRYATAKEEFSVGTMAIAVAILDREKLPMASISLAGSTASYTLDEFVATHLEPLKSTAEEIAEAWNNLNIAPMLAKD